MEIDLSNLRAQYRYGLVAVFVLALILLGRVVTPVEDDRPQLLSPQRWTLARLERQAINETALLVADAQALHAALAKESSDPITTMTLAQRIYVAHRAGTAATAAARQTLIEAAAIAARYSAGGVTRLAALNAVNAALERIEILAGASDASNNATVE